MTPLEHLDFAIRVFLCEDVVLGSADPPDVRERVAQVCREEVSRHLRLAVIAHRPEQR